MKHRCWPLAAVMYLHSRDQHSMKHNIISYFWTEGRGEAAAGVGTVCLARLGMSTRTSLFAGSPKHRDQANKDVLSPLQDCHHLRLSVVERPQGRRAIPAGAGPSFYGFGAASSYALESPAGVLAATSASGNLFAGRLLQAFLTLTAHAECGHTPLHVARFDCRAPLVFPNPAISLCIVPLKLSNIDQKCIRSCICVLAKTIELPQGACCSRRNRRQVVQAM